MGWNFCWQIWVSWQIQWQTLPHVITYIDIFQLWGIGKLEEIHLVIAGFDRKQRSTPFGYWILPLRMCEGFEICLCCLLCHRALKRLANFAYRQFTRIITEFPFSKAQGRLAKNQNWLAPLADRMAWPTSSQKWKVVNHSQHSTKHLVKASNPNI